MKKCRIAVIICMIFLMGYAFKNPMMKNCRSDQVKVLGGSFFRLCDDGIDYTCAVRQLERFFCTCPEKFFRFSAGREPVFTEF